MASLLGGFPWVITLILLPLVGGFLCFLWPRMAKIIGQVVAIVLTLCVTGLAWEILENGPYRHTIGGWSAPLGIGLYVDGLSLLMLAANALVGLGISVYSANYFNQQESIQFWPIWLFLLAALNSLFCSADIFNLYVTLELVGLAAVTLAAFSGKKSALSGAMRYLIANLLGSMAYLFGVVLLYHGFGSLDISILSMTIESNPLSAAALGLICSGLILKTALFPMHFWLPSAHASAPAPVSALLSALVVKASFYILLRLWLEIFSSFNELIPVFLGLLGAVAVLYGSIQALFQTRLKLLIAYSTVAQIGYLFLAFPLARESGLAVWNGVVYLALSHALAKAAMFLAAGNFMRYSGHDRIVKLDHVVQGLPVTASAFALAGVSIMGLPPSGGFVGKWLLLQVAVSQGRWDIVAILIIGGLLAAAYIFKVLDQAFIHTSGVEDTKPVPASREWVAFVLALLAILLGFLAPQVLLFLSIGDPFHLLGVMP